MNPAESTGPSRAFLDTYLQALRAFAPPGLARALPEALAARPDRASAALADLQARQLALWRRWFIDGTAVEPTAPESDPRFRDAAWREEPYFRLLHAQYRVWSDWAQAVPRTLGLEGHAARRVAFGLRQWIEASAPTLMLPWNPAALRTAIETGGRSLEQGLMNLRSDLAAGRIAMSAPDAFVVGRDLAVTAGDIVFENALIQVIQYRPTTGRVYRRPLVIVPPFINKFYILDLRPENSFVRWAVAQGHQVFLISWRNIGPAQATLDWTDYVRLGVFAALDVALDVADSPDANVLGFCVGGTLSATAAAVEATRNSARIASLTLLATLLDFSDPGDIAVYIDESGVDEAERDLGSGGVVPGSRLAHAFASLRARELVWHFVEHNYLLGKTPRAFDLLHWNGDGANLPGPLYTWYLRNLYLENRLTQANALRVDDVPLDLRRVQVPLYAFAARDDHIVPWRSAYAGAALLAGPRRFVLGESGHVAGVINPADANRRGYWTSGDLPIEADDWFAGTQHVGGSWWHDWAHWIVQHAGRSGAARKRPGSRRYRPIEPAPGRYVTEIPPAERRARDAAG